MLLTSPSSGRDAGLPGASPQPGLLQDWPAARRGEISVLTSAHATVL